MRSSTSIVLLSLTLLTAYFSSLLAPLLFRPDSLHRLSAAYRGFKAVSSLNETQVRSFIDSFELFSLEPHEYSASDTQLDMIRSYYSVLNHLCSVGDYEKMYLPPMIDPTVGVYENQIIFEKSLAARLNVTAGSRVLDIGCGRGLIARLVSEETGATVTGLNIDSVQIKEARRYATMAVNPENLDFVKANYNNPLPFPDGHFDAVYYVSGFVRGRGSNRFLF